MPAFHLWASASASQSAGSSRFSCRFENSSDPGHSVFESDPLALTRPLQRLFIGDQPRTCHRPTGAPPARWPPRKRLRSLRPSRTLERHRRAERWLSGLKRTPGEREWAYTPPGVRISLSPPTPTYCSSTASNGSEILCQVKGPVERMTGLAVLLRAFPGTSSLADGPVLPILPPAPKHPGTAPCPRGSPEHHVTASRMPCSLSYRRPWPPA
jgi:hypothetical protein